MLARKYSLAKDKDIQQVFKKGKIYFSPFFNIKILANNQQNSRFCIVVSTNISKKAVVRNKLKRQLKAIIYKKIPQIKGNYDIIILAKVSAVAITFTELEKTLTFLLKKSKII